MASTIESIGYAGTVGAVGPIDTVDWANLVGGFGATYAVLGVNSWKPGTTTAVARGVTVQPGIGSARGVMDTLSGDPVVVAADPLTSGSIRYDTLVARRHWATKTTSFVLRKGGATDELASTVVHNPGVEDDHPIAIYAISGGNAVLAHDLRMWRGGGGGLVAVDTKALDIIQSPGSRVWISDREYVCVPTSTGGTRWRPTSVPIFDVGSPLYGTPPADAEFKIQAGSQVRQTDASGFTRCIWPTPFPGGLVTAILTPGDVAANPGIQVQMGWTTLAAGLARANIDVVYRVLNAAGGVLSGYQHRVNYIAIGW